METIYKVEEKDLVLLRLNNNLDDFKQKHYNVWVRILFIDNDNTFYGKIERKEDGFNKFIDDVVKSHLDNVLDKYDTNDGRRWCYSDGVTRCYCKGLCKNK